MQIALTYDNPLWGFDKMTRETVGKKENKNRVGILFDALSFDTLYDFVISTLSGSNNINDNESFQPTKHLGFI